MSDKSNISRAFNTHFFEFIDDIIGIFPENKDIRESKVTFETFKRANPTAIIKVWYQYIFLPYSTIIETGDVAFFIEKDYKDDLSILKNAKDILKVIDKIRNPIKEMDETNKAHCMKYIQNLSKLSKFYCT
jgi:hypothetical protein